MADSFDPYGEWLGIKTGGRPLDFYLLLGLQRFESDPDVIGRAADAAMAKVRGVQPGEREAEWRRLLDRLSAAKTCLLDATTRAAYDVRLRNALSKARSGSSATAARQASPRTAAQQPTGGARPRVASPTGSSKPAAKPVAKTGASQVPGSHTASPDLSSLGNDLMADLPPAELGPSPLASSAAAPAAKSVRVRPVFALVLVAAVAVAGLVQYLMMSGSRPASARRGPVQTAVNRPAQNTPSPGPAAPQPTAPSPAPLVAPQAAPAAPAPAVSQKAPPASPPAASDEFVDPAFLDEPTQADAAAAQDAAKRQAEETAKRQKAEEAARLQAEKARAEAEKSRVALNPKLAAKFTQAVDGARTALANRNMVVAKRQVANAANSAQTPEDKKQVERLQTMQENLVQFWNGIQASMAKLQAAEEIAIKDTRIVVIESSREQVAVKALGRVHRFRIANMPASLVMALVERNFGHDAGSKAIIATFLAVDPNGDRALARQYWREAASAGIDCEKLLPEADAMPPVVSRHKTAK